MQVRPVKTSRKLSISVPSAQLRAMERTAKRENRTMSELVSELYRRYVADEPRREFGRVVAALRRDAAGTPAGKLTMRQIDAEIAAVRRERRRRSRSAG